MHNELERLNIDQFDIHGIENIPMAGRRYTIEVEIVSMFKVGLTELTPYSDVYDRYRERGYRTLTPEEAMEFRTQFLDQPRYRDMPRIGRIWTLIDLKVMSSFTKTVGCYSIISTGKGLSIGLTTTKGGVNPSKNGVEVCFAVVKE